MPESQPAPARVPRGIRNNNPGNIRTSTTFVWRGQDGADDAGFCRFTDAVWGLRAICIVWVNYRDHHNCQTLDDYIFRWAPPSENDSGTYAQTVARMLGVSASAPIDIHALAVPILASIVRYENGQQPYSVTELQRAVTLSHER